MPHRLTGNAASPLSGNIWRLRPAPPTHGKAQSPEARPSSSRRQPSAASLPLELRWLRGQPPHVGWWCASTRGDYGDWRWWNGRQWSQLVREADSPAKAGKAALRPAREKAETITWCEFWPADARVMREDPHSQAMKGRLPAASPWAGDEAKDWNQGPPPHIGWWNAASAPRDDIWRWWNGYSWSAPVGESCDAATAAKQAKVPSELPLSTIRWTHRWPQDARPRVDPRHERAQQLSAKLPQPGQIFRCQPPVPVFRFVKAPRSELVRRDSTPQYARKGDAIVVDADRRRSVVPWGQFVQKFQFNAKRGMCQPKRAPLRATELTGPLQLGGRQAQAGDFLVANEKGQQKAISRQEFLQSWTVS